MSAQLVEESRLRVRMAIDHEPNVWPADAASASRPYVVGVARSNAGG